MTETKHQPLSRDALYAISKEFLASEKLKNAPLEEKIEFLRRKGLSEREIEGLLEKARTATTGNGKGKEPTSAGSGTSSSSKPSPGESSKNEKSPVPSELKEIKKPTPVPSPSSPPPSQPQSQYPPPQQLQQPLIVTYPEFLAPPPQPPAPVNAQSLVAGMYYAGAAAVTVWGASKYIFQPMFDSLTAARADLASTALTNLSQFNSKLSTLVPNRLGRSYINTSTGGVGTTTMNPLTSTSSPLSGADAAGPSSSHDLDADEDSDSDAESSDSRSTTGSLRTHVFHQDASTQTIPEADDAEPPVSPENKLATISSHLATLVDSNSNDADSELHYELESLTTYLDTLRVDVSQTWWPQLTGAGGMGRKDDLTTVVKNEIRSVKGVLLNSKNFPTSR
ncbi:peroxisomal membrane anchor protein conserved region-domain-containing protein [Kalaharituber pfeilii]|nr:peroxisomal membrane anchor protein conserved region-domain-containing protein [Kalaharituber pfeilii]